MTGRIIGHYRLIDKLGEGGMGKVYRAIDTMVEREVAMKSLKPELAARPEVLERFRSEATTLARLNHPNVAQLYSFFKDGNEFYMVMEFVPGKTLEKVIQEEGAMPWRQALEIVAQILDGIQHAHQMGILHRDIKPANIILLDPGKGTGGFQPAAKVMDFGIAQALGGSRLTREGHLIGTLEYLAPERIQGKPADARSDLYSMAIVLYEMLTGKLPFHSDSEYSLLLAQVQQQPPRPREWAVDLPPAVEQTLLRALEKDPGRRFPDAATFAAALRQHAAPTPEAVSSTHAAAYQIDQFLAEVARIFRDLPPLPQLFARLSAAVALAWRDTTFRVVAICGTVVIFALSALLLAVVLRRPPAPPVEVAEAEQPAPAPRSSTPSAVIPQTPILPGTPIPIDQILRGSPGTSVAPGEGEATTETDPVAPSVLPPPVTDPPNPGATPGRPGAAPQSPRTQPAKPAWPTVAAALDATDGPTNGNSGDWPVHRAGLMAALRSAGRFWLPEITAELQRRGVNFLLTPSVERSLRDAGADTTMIAVVEKNLRSLPATTPTAPSTAAPSASAATPAQPPPPARAVSRLRDVETLYIERMKGELDELLRQELEKELSPRIKIVRNAATADARMTAQMEEDEGGMLASAGRVFGLKDKYRVIVRIRSSANSRDLWQHETGDKSPIVGAFGSKAMGRAVSRIVDRLREDLDDSNK